jgi:hypothetical protein
VSSPVNKTTPTVSPFADQKYPVCPHKAIHDTQDTDDVDELSGDHVPLATQEKTGSTPLVAQRETAQALNFNPDADKSGQDVQPHTKKGCKGTHGDN